MVALLRGVSLRVAALCALALLLLLAHQVTGLPSNLFWRSLTNSLHVPAFALLTVVIAFARPGMAAGRLLACGIGAGVLLELLQIVGERDASVSDLLRDAVGVGLGVLWLRGPLAARRARRAALLLVLTTVTVAAPTRILLAYAHRDMIFPELLDAASLWQRPLVHANSPSSVIAGPVPAKRVCWADVRYPGLHFDEVPADWSGYASLLVDVWLEGEEAVALTAAVGHERVPGTARFVSLELVPGANRLRYPLAALRGEESRRITHLILHGRRGDKGRCLRFQRVALD